ncbi:DNA phosphorothioation-dependent restriction protein DptG [Alteromonas antoniana]|uniref:DNA phosphorothioation-dependent restriction protein DptG n=1 Tax=Alteromonas antoniana TaxID=2803813 RepID=UPI001C488F36|nr:DNA phosphorothioation-dependent restriction protein DptG [Alteromonas antoniana]
MFRLKAELKPQNNKLTSFFPINTKDRKGIFDWDVVLGHFVKFAYRKSVPLNQVDEFKGKCKSAFESKLDEKEFWHHIESMYFNGDELYKISPELLLFKAQELKGSSANKRLGDLFLNLLQDFHLTNSPELSLNFLENEIVQVFTNFVQSGQSAGTITEAAKESPYLPFLSANFTQDLEFLASRPNYFLDTVTDFLKLYAFLYTAQLTLNIDEWKGGEPSPKPCFFILDTEKASDERTFVKSFGYRQLANNFSKVFPYLAMNESLQDAGSRKEPIWKVAQCIKDTGSTPLLSDYAQEFKNDRQLKTNIEECSDELDALSNLLRLSHDQFKRGESRHEINIHYCRAIESELCGHFIQNRGRAGRVLVFNQDYILLLTNLAIGKDERLRLHELITRFEARGVNFDKQTQKLLVNFYERIGNVERMSDSGDAVYVRKTV